MNLQPLYDVKERLEYAAIAGVSLLGEDFRLQRAAEGLKPLAAASPVFGKIDAGLMKLLAAPPERRSGLLLDVLALVDAVAYTQAKTGVEGELEPLPTGGGWYCQISYGQIKPLLTALTTTGGGRVEVVKSSWQACRGWFRDYRVLPAVIGGLGDSYGEMAELCAKILKKLGPDVAPMLKKDFDPAGKKEMARRVEIIAAVEKEAATSWLREVLPEAKKDVRAAVIAALGGGGGNITLLLDLTKSERGKNRDAALEALAKQDGLEVQMFWEKELEKNLDSVTFLEASRTDWASDLVARGLWDTMEQVLESGQQVPKELHGQIWPWWAAAKGKSSPSMLDLWRWTDAKMEVINKLQDHVGQPLWLGRQLASLLLDSLCAAGPGPLCELCLELWERHKESPRWLPHAVVASLLTRSASEVYNEFSPYVLTIKPLLGGEQKRALSIAVLKGLSRVGRDPNTGGYLIDNTHPAAQPLDLRWLKRLTRAVWKVTGNQRQYMPNAYAYGESIDEYDLILTRLFDPKDEEVRRLLISYLRDRIVEDGQPFTYSRLLFQLGGSPKGLLGEAMKKGKPAYLYYVWSLLAEAAKVLPAGEVADLCREVLDAKWIRPTGNELVLAETALPATIALLKGGRPFPDWDTWWKMR